MNKKAEFVPTGKVVTYTYAPDLFGGNDQPRMLYLNYDYGEKVSPQVNVSLKGRGAVNSTALKIKRMSPSLMPYSVEMNDGQFSLSTSFVKDQFLMISDEKGHEMVVIADSIPMEVDLIDGTLRGSRQNERFAECQRRLKALKDECHLYATEDATVVDTAGYHRLMTDVLQLQVQFMKENPDNLIPAWYLSQTFFNMSHEDLCRLETQSSLCQSSGRATRVAVCRRTAKATARQAFHRCRGCRHHRRQQASERVYRSR